MKGFLLKLLINNAKIRFKDCDCKIRKWSRNESAVRDLDLMPSIFCCKNGLLKYTLYFVVFKTQQPRVFLSLVQVSKRTQAKFQVDAKLLSITQSSQQKEKI